jgi:hypothetical protein
MSYQHEVIRTFAKAGIPVTETVKIFQEVFGELSFYQFRAFALF